MKMAQKSSTKFSSTYTKVGVILTVALVLLFLLSLISFSASAHSYRVLKSMYSYGTGCALSADIIDGSLHGGDGPCEFAIAGEVLLAVYAIVVTISVILSRLFRFAYL